MNLHLLLSHEYIPWSLFLNMSGIRKDILWIYSFITPAEMLDKLKPRICSEKGFTSVKIREKVVVRHKKTKCTYPAKGNVLGCVVYKSSACDRPPCSCLSLLSDNFHITTLLCGIFGELFEPVAFSIGFMYLYTCNRFEVQTIADWFEH